MTAQRSHLDFSGPQGIKPSQKFKAGRSQVLALSGGGYRGLYTIQFLANVEAHFKTRIAKHFDLLIGTSMGGLLSTALTFEIPAQTIVEKTIKHGPAIFPEKYFKSARKNATGAIYQAGPLREAVIDTLGESNAKTPLKDIKKPLAICAVNFNYGRPEVFRSHGLAKQHAHKTTVLDAVLASAAAPTYFPAHEIGSESYIDGGLIANAPEMHGLTEVISRLHRPADQVYVLAVGTAARKQGAALEPIGAASGITWMYTHDLVNSTIAVQEELARSQCTAILGDRYYIVDKQPLKKQEPAVGTLDLVSEITTKTLLSLADESWDEHRSRQAFGLFFKN